MIIALFPNEKKKQSFEIASNICKFLEEKGVCVVAEDEKAPKIGARPISSVSDTEIKFLISMGGDGTILRLSHRYSHLDAAIVGINLGHLGFMADIPTGDIYPSLTDLLENKFTIDEMLMLKAGPLQAVNDFVIHRASNYSLIELAIRVDGNYLNTFTADGVVIATPNGSTAYSLAAGGPILSPSIDAVVITPICPHTISNRPIVLSPNSRIEIEYMSSYDPIEVRADGLEVLSMKSKDRLIVERSSNRFKRVSLHRNDYFATLRTKLAWSGKLR
ncbi:MAG: NAD(+) kinase [Chlamydiae bacterium RIFCSPHIGHO2_12_FULL_44_59]|nr:MAG: NAD(+) kinase [Chlamydiae bacterium RIFCSPHIGHO2_02_FULL_45_9]OGN56842.1 MAG: NAD(+) kinase [Chlamydiae bacterium RIFCSPHIGHO2_01_FULL_44_39]OGN59501.1 MAG: NAD(+) kinase [Chlamydiae bacterium RIFCSPHIGHO2_12_FULL_44_59]OGN67246.1 MAG: NAD(+) kinase [Chlamydiae bacterium RIFCSPLOWO2_01_FULL_44_52]OGN68668.1 MAG: NAD(+) kinase [Chlamydiae bacterium RIFCSPLOWO2_02_FULL_45_22]OGN69189.1 MAG: NAD(+) kinase [Chlamydiae bacterium RIFCSPLOWO2_12_FULL_45_20]